jgi:glutathione S-transferase
MRYKLYMHPLSSFCMKAITAFYETGTEFEQVHVDLSDPKARADFLAVWPIGKFPVLRDEVEKRVVPESSIVIEYACPKMIPSDAAEALEARLLDRLFDFYLNEPVGKIVTDKFRPEGQRDGIGVNDARNRIALAYDLVDARLGSRTWAAGETFGLADCAAAPALFYASKITPFKPEQKRLAAYFERLLQRPSFRRVVQEAEPFMHMFPGG